MDGNGMCGAVLISKRFVLTAAHCIRSDNDFQIGITERTDGHGSIHHEYTYKWGLVHPNYDAARSDYDIALFELNEDVLDGMPYIRLGEIPVETPGTPMTVIGFGDTDPSDSLNLSTSLLQTTVDYIPQGECNPRLCAALKRKNIGMYSTMETCVGWEMVRSSMMCAYTEAGGECQGDSGGPLILEGTGIGEDFLVGLVSWGFDCAGESPSVYTRISHVYDWIVRSMCAMNPDGLPSDVDCGSGIHTLPSDSNLVYPKDYTDINLHNKSKRGRILYIGLAVAVIVAVALIAYIFIQRRNKAKMQLWRARPVPASAKPCENGDLI